MFFGPCRKFHRLSRIGPQLVIGFPRVFFFSLRGEKSHWGDENRQLSSFLTVRRVWPWLNEGVPPCPGFIFVFFLAAAPVPYNFAPQARKSTRRFEPSPNRGLACQLGEQCRWPGCLNRVEFEILFFSFSASFGHRPAENHVRGHRKIGPRIPEVGFFCVPGPTQKLVLDSPKVEGRLSFFFFPVNVCLSCPLVPPGLSRRVHPPRFFFNFFSFSPRFWKGDPARPPTNCFPQF